MRPEDRAVVRLRPKADARAIRHGYPWVWDSEMVTDRRTRSLGAGTIAELQDAARVPLATVAVNPGSRLMARVLDRDPLAVIDRDWLLTRLRTALVLRTGLYDALFYRWVHAEGDGLPGLVIDRFGTAAVVQPNAAWIDAMLPALCAAITELAPDVRTIVKNAGGRARASEGLDNVSALLAGQIDGPVEVAMNSAVYLADLMGGQKTGLYYDQRDNHAFFQRLARGARVLDVFSHVGGFGLAALAGGARGALALDSSQPALDLARRGATAMGRGDDFQTRRGDAFAILEALASEGATFDAVVCDPPAFAPSKKALARGLRAYERVARLAAPLVTPGGFLALCSCSQAAEPPKFLAASTRGIGRAGRQAHLIHTGFASADHPVLPQLGGSGYLKALFFRLTP